MKVCQWEYIHIYVQCGSCQQLGSDMWSLQGLPWSFALPRCWHRAHRSPWLHSSCWSRSPCTQHRWCTHTHTYMHTHTCRPGIDPAAAGLHHLVHLLAALAASRLQSPHAQTNGSLRWPPSPCGLSSRWHGPSDPSGSHWLLLCHAHPYLVASHATWPTLWPIQPDAHWWHTLTHAPSHNPVVAHRLTAPLSSGPTPAAVTQKFLHPCAHR